MKEALLKRFSILRKGEETDPANVVERAVDMHALRVLGSSGYQKCIKYLWRGWLVQDDEDPSRFIEYEDKDNTKYWAHLNPDRMRVPMYQNSLLIFFSLLYLGLYTAVINSVNPSGDLDVAEGILYTMTLSYLLDKLNKIIKIGRYYIGFWNVFNFTLYSLLTVSFVLRMVALGHSSNVDDTERQRFNQLSYDFLAFAAPMFWMRLLLFLDTFRFFGAMLVVLKVMMKESLIFFALLFVVLAGFLQAFIGMDNTDFDVPVTGKIIQGMANSVIQSPSFEDFEGFAPPFGIILYYIFNFVVMISKLSVLCNRVYRANKRLQFYSISSLLYTTAHTKISRATQTTNTWPCSRRGHCSMYELQMRTFLSHVSISSLFNVERRHQEENVVIYYLPLSKQLST